MVNVLGYVRVSTKGQVKDGYSLDDQIDKIKEYCAVNRFNLVDIFDDGGKSGAADEDEVKLYKRDGLLDLFDRLENDRSIKLVIVLTTNRLWRDEDASYMIKKHFKKYGVDVRAIDRPNYSIYKSTNPHENLINHILEDLDEFERDEIAVKLKRGRMKKAALGGYSGGKAPYGYRSARGAKVLEIEPREAEGVRRLFDLVQGCPGMTLRELASELNLEGYRGRNGGGFSPMLVKRILDREDFYRGFYKYKDIESIGQHNAIL